MTCIDLHEKTLPILTILLSSIPSILCFCSCRNSSQRLRDGVGSFCEWKGRAVYYDLCVGDEGLVCSEGAAWAYHQPTERINPKQKHGWSNFGSGQSTGTGGSFAPLKDMVAFYCSKVDECWVAGERASPQEGDFYGGWITSWIDGGERGIKGAAGTSHY